MERLHVALGLPSPRLHASLSPRRRSPPESTPKVFLFFHRHANSGKPHWGVQPLHSPATYAAVSGCTATYTRAKEREEFSDSMGAWDKNAVCQMAQGVAGYSDVQRLAADVEEVLRELRSLAPKVDKIGAAAPPRSSLSLALARRAVWRSLAPLRARAGLSHPARTGLVRGALLDACVA